MPKISIIITADTRPEKSNSEGIFSGTVSMDYLTFGVENKKRFFDGFDIETILCIDQHIPLDENQLGEIRELVDVLLIRKHTDEHLFNDWNYWRSFALASGDIICKFDQDTACFTSSPEPINEFIGLLDSFSYISYPSHWTPNAVHDPAYDYQWASTRFFMCKRDTIDLTEIRKCLLDYEYCFSKYPASRAHHWMEHALGLTAKYNGKGVFYPPMDLDRCAIFSWGSYEKWTLRRLNQLTYPEIRNWLNTHPIQYPNDVFC